MHLLAYLLGDLMAATVFYAGVILIIDAIDEGPDQREREGDS
jgi:hypothetical protein